MENIRLIIWDLDETFWEGTISEGPINPIPAHAEIVVELARRGIVSSICSKNYFESVRAELEDQGVWDYFVFPSVNWEPKGARIAALVEAVQLRPGTILFIDDNPANLREALAETPGLQIAGPEVIAGLLDDPRCRGKHDPDMTRLAQYKLLQQRRTDMQAATNAGGSNVEFLRASNIRVVIEHDVAAHIDRAVELINRTNQLNFTKQRLPDDPAAAREALLARLRNFNTQAGLLRVMDSYGDYGFVGFYLVTGAVEVQSLVHFCFSCRIMGMGVERWLYDRLGRPELTVRGDVVADVFARDPVPDWLHLAGPTGPAAGGAVAPQVPEVRLRGGCDGQALLHYLGLVSGAVLGEFNTVHAGEQIRIDHSSLLRLALDGPGPQVSAAVAPLGFTRDHLTTRLFEQAAPGTLWVFSNWIDTIIHVYRHRSLGFRIPYLITGFGQIDMTRLRESDLRGKLAERSEDEIALRWRQASYLRQHFEFEGLLPDAEMRANFAAVFRRVPQGGRLFALLAPEAKALPAGTTRPFVERQMRLNAAMRDVAAAFPAVTLLDINECVKSDGDVAGLLHFDRMVYFRLYRAMMSALEVRPARAAA